MLEQIINLDAMEQAVSLFGSFDENIKIIEKEFDVEGVNPNGMLKAIAEKRNLVSPEGRADTKRAASVFLHELRRGKYGGLTLERPDETDTQNMSE